METDTKPASAPATPEQEARARILKAIRSIAELTGAKISYEQERTLAEILASAYEDKQLQLFLWGRPEAGGVQRPESGA
jgi:regulator of protease activity HflC (stomatin/prohibitin superfamily)